MAARLPRLGVSNDGRILVTGKGKPFFWLGDTAWELFQRLDRREAAKYLGTRARQRFTLIQAVVLAEFDGLHTPNRYGEKPLVNDDPEQPNEKYMRHVDWVIRSADRLGLYVGVLPTWGDKVNVGQWGTGPVVFNEAKAHAWGRYLGNRWREETNLVWVLGGDRIPVYEGHDYRALWRAMAAGIDAGSGQRALKTYHPSGGSSSSQWLHGEPWLDVNMMQSGHGGGHDVPVWEWIERDLALAPPKPTLDGEPNYEDHPVNPWPKWDPRNGYFRDWDVRKQLYRSVFAGGCGVTYGHHFVWQMWAPGREPVNNGNELIAWREAIQRPGARQVCHLAALMTSRPTRTRVADQGLLVSDPGAGGDHVRAMRDAEGAWAFVYLPTPRAVTVNLKRLGGRMVRVRWLDPVDGTTIELGRMDADAARTFTPPGDRPDRVLVVDRLA
ncbi:MAG: glycoside hydrolase family 140 protein [Candidatus Coatesbacteria bacterium]